MNNKPTDSISKVLIESAKAEQEQQKTAQSLIALAKDTGAFLGRICGQAADEFGLMMGEQMRYWRFVNFVRIATKAEKLVRARGINPSEATALPFGDAIRMLDSASFEDDESVQDLWARLIANAADPNINVTIKKAYVELLKSLSAPEVVFLDLLSQSRKMPPDASAHWKEFSDDMRRVSIQNLIRNRCIAVQPSAFDAHDLFAILDPKTFSQTNNHFGYSRPHWSAINPERLANILDQMIEMIFIATGVRDIGGHRMREISARSSVTLLGSATDPSRFILTPLGSDLMAACRQ